MLSHPPTHRSRGPVSILLVLAVLGGAGSPAWGRVPRVLGTFSAALLGPVYTVAQLQRAVARDPDGWDGRQVLVQGRAALYRTWSPPDSIVTRLALVEPGRSDSSVPLSLQWGSPDPLLASWRRMPLVGRLAPRPQRPQWGTLAVYRIQLHGQPGGFPGGDDAVLLDAAPG
jgi:hypothetical protein